jgi:hypothetical protein
MVRQLNWDCAFLRNISPFVCPNHQSAEKRFGWPQGNAPAIMIHDEAANLIDRKDPAHMATTVAAPLRLGLADHGRKMTLEEFREADEENGYRYELARGVLEVSEVNTSRTACSNTGSSTP